MILAERLILLFSQNSLCFADVGWLGIEDEGSRHQYCNATELSEGSYGSGSQFEASRREDHRRSVLCQSCQKSLVRNLQTSEYIIICCWKPKSAAIYRKKVGFFFFYQNKNPPFLFSQSVNQNDNLSSREKQMCTVQSGWNDRGYNLQPSWPSRPNNFCGCNNKLFNAYQIYYIVTKIS